jgi:hypothetical protein
MGMYGPEQNSVFAKNTEKKSHPGKIALVIFGGSLANVAVHRFD